MTISVETDVAEEVRACAEADGLDVSNYLAKIAHEAYVRRELAAEFAYRRDSDFDSAERHAALARRVRVVRGQGTA